jgi:hypothetical protein
MSLHDGRTGLVNLASAAGANRDAPQTSPETLLVLVVKIDQM